MEFTTSTTALFFLPTANLDNIAFSIEPIPEPNSLLLLTVGGIVLFSRKHVLVP